MSGRFALFSSGERIAEGFDLDEVPELRPRYNIAPTGWTGSGTRPVAASAGTPCM
jgi:putative SOS response-associated peptidase YedK